jgi:hypothetical protein
MRQAHGKRSTGCRRQVIGTAALLSMCCSSSQPAAACIRTASDCALRQALE